MLKLLRLTHRYLGVFIAPALLFFAFTGALQTFGLHETTPGSSYKPSVFLQTMGQIHKKQTWVLPARKTRPADAPTAPAGLTPAAPAASIAVAQASAPSAPPARSHMPLKIFFLLVSIGLFISTITGICMSYKFEPRRWLVTVLLIAGAVIPLVLLPY